MSKKKIIKTTQSAASLGNNIIIINASPSKGSLKPLDNICKALNNIKSASPLFLISKDSEKWNILVDGNKDIQDCLANGNLKFENNIAAVQEKLDENSIANIFFLPLNYNRDATSYGRIIGKLSGIAGAEKNLYALGKNTASKAGLMGKVFGTIANAWSRIIHGINSKNIASNIIGFSTTKYQELTEKYGNLNPLTLLKLGYEENEEVHSIDGDFGNDAYSFGAGFIAIAKAKMAVASALPKRFFQIPLRDMKADGIHLKNPNSSFYKFSYFIVAVLMFFTMMLTATDFNTTWDEPGHLKYSEDIASYVSSFGDDTTVFVSKQTDATKGYDDNFLWYGASIDTIAHAVHSITGGNIYKVRRYLNGVVSFLMLLIIALLAKHFFGWRAALLALLAGFFSPSFHGHFYNNHKDIPFALGYIMTAYYLVILLTELPKPKFQTMFMLALGVGFSLSIRASGLAQFGFVFAFLGLHWMLINKGKDFIKYILWFIGMGLAAYIIGISLWPSGLRNPLSGPLNAFKEFSNFQALNYMELFEGVRMKDKPWYYEPKLILITAPLMMIAGWILFALTSLIKKDKAKTFGLSVLLVMAFAPTVYAIYQGSYLYNGWRHFLFIYPILIILAIWGWEKLIGLLNGIKITAILIPILAVALLIPAAIFQIKNHPYHYMYYNELIGGMKGAEGNYEFDYWSQTPKEAMNWMKENLPEAKNKRLSFASNNIAETFTGMNDETDSFRHIWSRETEWYNKRCDYVVFTSRTLSKSQILGGNWPPLGTIHEIKVDGVTIAAIAKKQNDYSADARYLMQAQKVDSALGLLMKAHNVNPNEEEYARGIAQAYLQKNNLDSAQYYFSIASELKDHNYDASFGLAQCYLNKSGFTTGQITNPELIIKAKEKLLETVNSKSNYSTAYYYLGVISQTEQDDYKAINYFNKTLRFDPNGEYIYKALGQSYLTVGKLDSAVISLNTCIGIEEYKKRPNPESYRLLAQIYQKKGDMNMANQVMQRYQQLVGGSTGQK